MLDYKKQYKDLYQPKTAPSVVDVPEMTFIALQGQGDPNGEAFALATQTLYGLSYAIKMSSKGILEYVVPPLEGIWWGEDAENLDKSRFEWWVVIRQPEFVTQEIFEAAKIVTAKKKPELRVAEAELIRWTEGLCVQALHIGPYDLETVTIAAMERFALESGYVLDVVSGNVKNISRRHHEIYLGDPRKTAPEKLKTVIRYPVRRDEQAGEVSLGDS